MIWELRADVIRQTVRGESVVLPDGIATNRIEPANPIQPVEVAGLRLRHGVIDNFQSRGIGDRAGARALDVSDRGIDVAPGGLGLGGCWLSGLRIRLRTTGGGLEHAVLPWGAGLSAGPLSGGLVGLRSGFCRTPLVGPATDFRGGAGITTGKPGTLLLDSNQMAADLPMAFASIDYNETGRALYVRPAISRDDVGGAIRRRLVLEFTGSAGAGFALGNLPVDGALDITLFAFLP